MDASKVLRKLKSLTPTEFERLTFDLLILTGLQNPVWRTPGADGGRDIEGEIRTCDFSGAVFSERWYIECKRYRASLDWPTVYGKIAYASNHDADALLIVTSATISPNCKDEIQRRWNRRERPTVRYWDATVLPEQIARHPLLMTKYGLEPMLVISDEAAAPLTAMSMKALQSAYGRASIMGDPDPALEFASAVVDMLQARTQQARLGDPFRACRTDATRDLYPWCDCANPALLQPFDCYGLRSVLAGLRFITRTPRVELDISAGTNGVLSVLPILAKASPVLSELASLVTLWSNIEVRLLTGVGLTANCRT